MLTIALNYFSEHTTKIDCFSMTLLIIARVGEATVMLKQEEAQDILSYV